MALWRQFAEGTLDFFAHGLRSKEMHLHGHALAQQRIGNLPRARLDKRGMRGNNTQSHKFS
jgi:hypothetical protein